MPTCILTPSAYEMRVFAHDGARWGDQYVGSGHVVVTIERVAEIGPFTLRTRMTRDMGAAIRRELLWKGFTAGAWERCGGDGALVPHRFSVEDLGR